jgi:hypothetical protein
MGLRYAVREVERHGTDKQWWRKRFLTHVVSKYYTALADHDPTPVIAADWDNLLVLDACRYDLFAEVLEGHPLPGELSVRTATDSGTPGFLESNFGTGTFHDTVYVTANPYVDTELDDRRFHAVDAVWRDGWDDELRTVRPETMAERTIAAAESYPEKRIIAHFLQPHAPFVGETRLGERKEFAIRQVALDEPEPDPRTRVRTPFERLEAGELTREKVWRAYRDNLKLALPAIEELLASLPGRTAVTSDHGNAFGEFASPFPIRVYGHPLGVLVPALTDVPWFVSTNGERKAIRAAPPIDDRPEPDDRAEPEDRSADRLRALGYVE